MKEAAVPGFRLSKSKKSLRVLTSLALIGMLLGLVSSALLTISKTGLSADSVSYYYLGSGLSAAFEGSADGLLINSPRPFAELMEITHLHLFAGSILLFLLCHLLSLCEVSETFRTGLYLVSFLSFILTFSLPWMIVYLTPTFSYLFAPSVILFLVSLLFLVVIPIREMWFV